MAQGLISFWLHFILLLQIGTRTKQKKQDERLTFLMGTRSIYFSESIFCYFQGTRCPSSAASVLRQDHLADPNVLSLIFGFLDVYDVTQRTNESKAS